MNNIQKTIVGVLALAVLVLGGLYFNKSSVSTEQASGGSVTGPDSFYPCTSSNGVTQCKERKAFTVGTTTPNALRSLVSATSTLVQASCQFDVSSTTASTVTFAKATTAYATTTVLATSTIAANAKANLVVASTTPVADTTLGRLTLTDRIFAPGDWLVVGMSGGAGTFSPSGACSATFEKF